MDGWSNVHNELVVCVAVTDSLGKTYMTDTVDTIGTAHTGNNLTPLARDSIHKTEGKFGCKIRSLVTDNASNMAAMRRELKDDDKNDISYGCGVQMSTNTIQIISND